MMKTVITAMTQKKDGNINLTKILYYSNLYLWEYSHRYLHMTRMLNFCGARSKQLVHIDYV